MSNKSFRGIHPPDMKFATSSVPVEAVSVPAGFELYISLAQHIGAPARPVVTKEQPVRAGEQIAEANGFISANIHSPVDGTVTAVDVFVDYPGNTRTSAIVIKTADNQSGDFVRLPEALLADTARAAGIVGMGGAMFPSHVKLSPKEQLDTLIVNGVECEPFLTCDHRLMLERTSHLISGTLTIKEALKLKKAVIGIEANKPDAADAVRRAAKDRLEVILLPLKYPQGGERQLIKSVTGREVPEGKLPAELGVLVHNVSTVLAVYDAMYGHKPLTHRVVTVTGDVKQPKNLLVPIGMSISHLIDLCGGAVGEIEKVILGGPMTGFAVQSLNIPVYKGMNGVVVYTKKSGKDITPPVLPCIRCSRCVDACPAGLSPVMLENFAAQEMYEELAAWKLLSCIECSACNYVCPSSRPLKNLFRLAKKQTTAVAAKRA